MNFALGVNSIVNDNYLNDKSNIHAIGHSPPILHSTVVQTFFVPDYGGYYQTPVKHRNLGLQLDYDIHKMFR